MANSFLIFAIFQEFYNGVIFDYDFSKLTIHLDDDDFDQKIER